MNTDLPKLPGATDYADDAALLAYLRQMEADERVREDSESYL
jgi:hypothetical protein